MRPTTLLGRAALLLLGVAWALHAFGTLWRAEAGAEVAKAVTERSGEQLADPIAAALTEAGVSDVDTKKLGDALERSSAAADAVGAAAAQVWEDELSGTVSDLGSTLGWAVDVGKAGAGTTITLDPGAVGELLADVDPDAAEAWNSNPATQRDVVVDVSALSNLASIGALPTAAARYAAPIAALGLILAALAIVAAVGHRASTLSKFGRVAAAVGIITWAGTRLLSWAADRDDTAGLVADAAHAAAVPLASQGVLLTIAGLLTIAVAAALSAITRPS